MKKIIIAAGVLVLTGAALLAQKPKVTTAYMSFENYKKEKDMALLTKAKTNIDDASVHADTKDDAKTWVYRGNIYLALYQADFNAAMASITDVSDAGKKQSMAYSKVNTANLIEATNAYIKGKGLDKYKTYADDVNRGLGDCYFFSQNIGIANYNQQNYGASLPMFELAVSISNTNGKSDTLNTNNAAVSALYGKEYDKAIGHFKKLTEWGYGKGNTWLLLGQCYASKGDSAAYKTTIADGLKKYPTDADLLTEDVNIKLKEGKSTEAIAQLEALVGQRKDDPELYFVVGNVYDRMANPTGADGKPADKPKNFEELHEKAAANYKKALELKPGYFDVIYNLGILYYNFSTEYYNRANSTLADAAKYNSMWEAPLKTAVDYLEQARKLQPDDLNTVLALKICYANLGDTDNYNKMKAEISRLQGK